MGSDLGGEFSESVRHSRYPRSDVAVGDDDQAQHGAQQAKKSGSHLPSANGSKKGERSRSGCITCRARKVKCDERPGSCMNCARRGLSCSGYSSGPLSRSTRNQLRAQSACRACKTKCSGDRPACGRCLEKGLGCTYGFKSKQIERHSLPSPQSTPSHSEFFYQRQSEVNATSQDVHEESVLARSQDSRSGASFPLPYSDDQTFQRPNVQDTGLPDWLFLSPLPSKEKIYQLVDNYFRNIHPLRCYAFIHRPSFMERLDQDPDVAHTNNPLLYVMCALGAKFYALETQCYVKEIEPRYVLAAGSQWADVAQRQIFSNINHITVENLMATILLYDHELRVGNYGSVFMLSGTAIRMSQALQINLEYSTDILCTEQSNMSCCARESRRRLMWSCYVMDSWVGSGVDQLTLIDDCDIKVQLPCHERNFLHQVSTITETLTKGQVLKFIPEELRPPHPVGNMGIAAYFTRIAGFRKSVLRYIKQIGITQPQQLPDLEFASLDTSFEEWFNSLPPTLHLTTASIYTRKDSNQLGALFLLHCAYHVSLCDLYRISMPMLLPGLLRTRSSVELTPNQQSFRVVYQRKCFEHAKSVAGILAKAIEHGSRLLADTWLCTCAFESIRTMLYYSVQGAGQDPDASRELMSESIPLFRTNMKAIRLMIPLFATADRCYTAATALLRKAGLGPQLVEGAQGTDEQLNSSELERPIDHASPPGESPENVLNPLSIYALTRQNIDEKRSEDITSPGFSTRAAGSPRELVVPMNTSRQRQIQSSTCDPTLRQQQFSLPASQPDLHASTSSFIPNMTPIWQQHDLETNTDPFWMTFMSDLDGSWLPAETAQENITAMGMPPWAPGLPDERFGSGFT